MRKLGRRFLSIAAPIVLAACLCSGLAYAGELGDARNDEFVANAAIEAKGSEELLSINVQGISNAGTAYALLDKVNKERNKSGVKALTWDSSLEKAALIRAAEKCLDGSKVRPDKSSFETVVNGEMAGIEEYASQYGSDMVLEWMRHSGRIADASALSMGAAGFTNYDGTTVWVLLTSTDEGDGWVVNTGHKGVDVRIDVSKGSILFQGSESYLMLDFGTRYEPGLAVLVSCPNSGDRFATCNWSSCSEQMVLSGLQIASSDTTKWSSSNTDVATVDSEGIVAKALGKAVLSAEAYGEIVTCDVNDVGKDVSNAEVDVSPWAFFYDGKSKKPSVTVTLDSEVLKEGSDYTLEYDDAVMGMAYVVVSGVGNYRGTARGEYHIYPSTASFYRTDQQNGEKIQGVFMHRLYNQWSGEHFYTADDAEAAGLVEIGWTDEGEGWKAPVISETPVFRLYNSYAGEHHYTMDADERDLLVAAGWTDEDTGWYSDDAKTAPLYREYNPNAFANNHNYTTDAGEHASLISLGWVDEGEAWYGV